MSTNRSAGLHACTTSTPRPNSTRQLSTKVQHRAALYSITVENPERRCRGVASVTLDGSPVDASAIPLTDDGSVHRVHVVLGAVPALAAAAHAKNLLL